MTEPSRFDYVEYTPQSAQLQARFKEKAKEIEKSIVRLATAIDAFDDLILESFFMPIKETELPINAELARDHIYSILEDPEAALVALEESYLWVGKSIRDMQLKSEGIYKLQEERNNS